MADTSRVSSLDAVLHRCAFHLEVPVLMAVASDSLRPEWPTGDHPHVEPLFRRCVAQSAEERPSFSKVRCPGGAASRLNAEPRVGMGALQRRFSPSWSLLLLYAVRAVGSEYRHPSKLLRSMSAGSDFSRVHLTVSSGANDTGWRGTLLLAQSGTVLIRRVLQNVWQLPYARK